MTAVEKVAGSAEGRDTRPDRELTPAELVSRWALDPNLPQV